MPFLTRRRLEPEEMDSLALPERELQAALAGLARLNWASNSNAWTWPLIKRVAGILAPQRIRILDIATGSGDVPIALWHLAHRQKLDVEIHGIDVNPKTIQFARHKAQESGAEVVFECVDVLNDELRGEFDIVMCSLFLHHLTNEQAVTLMRKMAGAAKALGILVDLRRSLSSYLLAYCASRLLSRSGIVHRDAVRSVRAAFTVEELGETAEQAGVPPGRAFNVWPARMAMVWYTPNWCAHVQPKP